MELCGIEPDEKKLEILRVTSDIQYFAGLYIEALNPFSKSGSIDSEEAISKIQLIVNQLTERILTTVAEKKDFDADLNSLNNQIKKEIVILALHGNFGSILPKIEAKLDRSLLGLINRALNDEILQVRF